MKKVTVTALLLAVLGAAAALAWTGLNTPAAAWPEPGVYFDEWQAYHALLPGEEPSFHLTFIEVHRGRPTINAVVGLTMHGDAGDVRASDVDFLEGATRRFYSGRTLAIRLPALPPGSHRFHAASFTTEDGRTFRGRIGNWHLEVLPETSPVSLDVRSWTIAGGVPFYRTALENVSASVVVVDDLVFGDPLAPALTGRLYLAESDELSAPLHSADGGIPIEPGRTATLHYHFASGSPQWVSLKPAVRATSDGLTFLVPLRPTVYDAAYPADDAVLQHLRTLQRATT